MAYKICTILKLYKVGIYELYIYAHTQIISYIKFVILKCMHESIKHISCRDINFNTISFSNI